MGIVNYTQRCLVKMEPTLNYQMLDQQVSVAGITKEEKKKPGAHRSDHLLSATRETELHVPGGVCDANADVTTIAITCKSPISRRFCHFFSLSLQRTELLTRCMNTITRQLMRKEHGLVS